MAKIDRKKFQLEAERRFPGDRAQQDAWIEVMTAPPASAIKKRASTAGKKKVVKKVAAPARRRRSF